MGLRVLPLRIFGAGFEYVFTIDRYCWVTHANPGIYMVMKIK